MSEPNDGNVWLAPLTNSVSGTEQIALQIGAALAGQGKPVGAIIPAVAALDSYAAAFARLPARVRRIPPVHGRRSLAKSFQESWRLFRQIRPQIVHFHCPSYRWGLEVVAAAGLARVPLVIRTEQNPLMAPPERMIAPLLAWTDRYVRVFTYVSEGNQQRFEGLLPYRQGRGVLIRNGVAAEKFNVRRDPACADALRVEFGFPPESRLAVYVGSFGGRRPLTTLIAAFGLLLNSDERRAVAEGWRLLIVGDGLEDTKTLPQTLGIASWVRFAGRRSDIGALLPLCDLYVSDSHFEGLSIALLEAWASGLPVLVTQVDGLTDVLGAAGVARVAVPQGDIPAYADAWYAFMQDYAACAAAQSEVGAKVRAEFTTDRMLANYLELYER